PSLVMSAWVFAGILALCGALTLAELSAMIPDSGGPYAFLRRAFGQPIAFAYGWMMFFLGAPLAAAALAAGGAIFLNLLSNGALHSFEVPYSLAGLHGAITGTQLAALALLAAVALVNLAPVRTNGMIAIALAAVKIVMLVALTIGAFILGSGSWEHFSLSGAAGACTGIAAATRGGAAGFGAAMLGALYAYQGWSSLTYVAGEAKDPGRTLPRALIASMFVVIGVYVAANVAYFYILTPTAIASVSPASSVGLEVLGRVFGANAQGLATALLFISVVATLHVSILTNSRITYALAADGDLLRWLSGVTAGTHIPATAVIVGAGIAGVLVLLGSFDTLSDFQVFSVWVFYGLTGVSAFVLRRKEPDTPRPYRIFGYPIVPVIFVAATVWLLFEAVVGAPARSLIGLGIIALALPAYALLKKRAVRADI
ncbi:MAG TPA: amino acid permease, partial [Candidatus Eremiobacteraceae bacterium]|nr:amino acid permease [Candidatus Eremiobacteraceae bacterium]